MSQRNILENSINLINTLRGPAKILYAASAVGMPSLVANIINATTGAPAASWIALGLTRGGINVSKNLDIAIRDDVDQILGAYDQDITDRNYTITTQLAEVIAAGQDQLAFSMAMDTVPTISASVAAVYEQMRFLDDGANKTPEWRLAVVFPKATNGKLLLFVFRRAAVAGGEKVFRFDKNDPASPPLELRAFPEIATTISPNDAYGRLMELI